jgi:hypothetical protein
MNSMSVKGTNNEEAIVLLVVCLNNAGVKSFERGNLHKALNFFLSAVNSVMASINSKAATSKISKKMAIKVAKSQSRSFLPGQAFEICESAVFGKRRQRHQKLPLAAQVAFANEHSSTYTYQRVFGIKASNSEPLLDQTSPRQLMAIILSNLAICHHLNPGNIIQAMRYYELALQAAYISGDLMPQLVIWNNLLQVYSNHIPEHGAARICRQQLETKITQLRALGLLAKLKKYDRRGFLLNIMFLGAGTLAPAA